MVFLDGFFHFLLFGARPLLRGDGRRKPGIDDDISMVVCVIGNYLFLCGQWNDFEPPDHIAWDFAL